MRVRYKGNDVIGPQVRGTEEAYMAGGQVEIKHGRFFTDNESQHRMPVVVIGSDIYKRSSVWRMRLERRSCWPGTNWK